MKDNKQTAVVFRKYNNGEILALFPYEDHSYLDNNCVSYMHIGQHGAADYIGCIYDTKPAKEEEYKDLFEELENIGYNLKVIKKRTIKR